MTEEIALKRLLYLACLDNSNPRYISGDPDKYSLSKEKILLNGTLFIKTLVENDQEKALKIIETANEDVCLPRRSTLFFTLAQLLKYSKNPSQITNVVLKITKTDAEFFDFIKYHSLERDGKHKLSKTVRKAVCKFYEAKSPKELVLSYISARKYHSWSHKDLIKYVHFKSDTPIKNLVVNYILTKKKVNAREGMELINLIETYYKLSKDETPEDEVLKVMQELKLTYKHVLPKHFVSPQIWNESLPQMQLSEILKLLPRLYKLRVLKPETPFFENLIKQIRESVGPANIHPVEFYIHIKSFEKGGKPVDPKLLDYLKNEKKKPAKEIKKLEGPHEIKLPALTNPLYKCLVASYNNLKPLNKRFLIVIDNCNERVCLQTKHLTGLEASLSYTLSLIKVEKDVTVGVYKKKGIEIVNLDKNGSFEDNFKKLTRVESSFTSPFAGIEYAYNKNKHFDIFINFIQQAKSIPSSTDIFKNYKKKVNLPNAKCINVATVFPRIKLADGSPNMIDIIGFEKQVLQVIEAFCKGNFP